mgnify:CR=1 FL=1
MISRHILRALNTVSTPPAPPSRWPVENFVAATGSRSEIRHVPYAEAFGSASRAVDLPS